MVDSRPRLKRAKRAIQGNRRKIKQTSKRAHT
jgi:hypothetical protein